MAEELELAKRLCDLARRDSRLGFEAANHYAYTANDLKEKVIQCAWLAAPVRRARGRRGMTGLEAWRRHDAGWVELETADAPCALTRGEDAVPLGGCAKRQIGLTVAGVTRPGLTTVFLHSLLQLALLGCLIPVRAAEQTPRSAPNTWGLTSWSGAGNGGSGLPVGPRAFVNGHTALYPFKRVRLVLANLNDTPLTVRGLRAVRPATSTLTP